MKKKLLTLSPIVCSLVLSQGTIRSMESTIEEEVTILTLDVPVQRATSTGLLDELRNHPKFINTSRPDYNKQIEAQQAASLATKKELEKLEQDLKKEFGLDTVSDDETGTQEQLNLAISQLMSGSVAVTQDGEQDATRTPAKSGFGWLLSMKALTHTPADLLLYTLKNEMFEVDNSDHNKLLNTAILECISTQADKKLIEILTLTKEKHANTLTLEDKTSKQAYTYLTDKQEAQRTTFIQRFSQLNIDKQILCKASIIELQKQYDATVARSIELMNSANGEFKTHKDIFKDRSNKDKKIISALRKMSNSTLAIETPITSWDALTKDTPNAIKQLDLTLTDLNNSKAAIQSLSKHLLIEDKQ